MKTIWEYPVLPGSFSHLMPVGAIPLCVQEQNGDPFLWCLVDNGRAEEHRHFRVFGTGHEMPDGSWHPGYIGTWQQSSTGFVWHLFGDQA